MKGETMIQQAGIKQWQDLNQNAVDLYKRFTEEQTEAIRNLMELQGDSVTWAKLMQSSLDSYKTLSNINQTTLSSLWQAHVARVDLTDVASSMKELCQIYSSATTTLVQNQMNGLSAIVEGMAKYIEAVKQAKSWEELVAAQAHLVTEIQESQKGSSLDSLQTFGSVSSALTAWAENTIDSAASEERKMKVAAASPRTTAKAAK